MFLKYCHQNIGFPEVPTEKQLILQNGPCDPAHLIVFDLNIVSDVTKESLWTQTSQMNKTKLAVVYCLGMHFF